MTFKIAAGKGTTAVIHVANVEDDLGAFFFRRRVDLVGVGNDEVDAFRLAESDLVGLDSELSILASVVHGAKHDHASTKGELRMSDDVVFAHVDGVLFETEGADEPVDCSESVAVAKAWNKVQQVCTFMFMMLIGSAGS